MLLIVGIILGGIILYKTISGLIHKIRMANHKEIETVSTMKAGYSPWQQSLSANGSLRAIRGVNVTTELAGMVQTIYFKPGSNVKAGDVLIQLNANSDIALLHSLEANAELALITYERDKAQYQINAVSKQVLDNDAANLKSLRAQVAQQQAIVEKKTIKAPFTGRLGINLVNPGQYLNTGDKVVSLQTLNPIYADFYVPQQNTEKIKVGQPVVVVCDAFPNSKFYGKITTIDSAMDSNTRNLEVEATINNPDLKIVPGMFVDIDVTIGEPQKFITIPQTAVTFNSYGNLVYIVEEKGKTWKGEPILQAFQHFIITGDTRGEQIKVLKGLNANDEIVTSGQLKLKNGTQIAINNAIQPSNNPSPVLENDH